MGVVYQARQTMMNRPVVIKVINQAVLEHPDALERFRREVRAAAQLSHPNIVTAYDAEQAGDLHMLVMEFVPGQSLAEVLHRQGPLPVTQACQYARQAALGLQHAHEQRTVHRDIKPQNLMLTPQGQVKILDFGLAKVVKEHRSKRPLTASHSYMGTPEYSAPEQATDARSADIRADLYSLGCTLYCLLAGRPPFREDTPVKTILAHLEKEPPPLPQLRPDVPAGLGAVVARLLAKDPARRYQTPAEVVQALAPFCKQAAKAAPFPTNLSPPPMVGSSAGPAPAAEAAPRAGSHGGRRRRVWPWSAAGAGGAALVLLGIILVLKFTRPDGSSTEIRLESKPDEVAQGKAAPPPRPAAKLSEPAGPPAGGPAPAADVRPAPAPTKPQENPKPAGQVVRHYLPANPAAVPRGEWRVEGGELVQTRTTPAFFFFGDKDWGDYDLELEAQRVSGPEGFKILFRAAGPLNFHALGLGSYGATAHEVFRVENGDWVRSVNPVPGRVEPQRWYKVRVEARGDTFRCLVDGSKLFEFTDGHFARGQVGLSTWGTVVRFRNIKVTAADGRTVLWDGLPKVP
jgi:hypothetical protein